MNSDLTNLSINQLVSLREELAREILSRESALAEIRETGTDKALVESLALNLQEYVDELETEYANVRAIIFKKLKATGTNP